MRRRYFRGTGPGLGHFSQAQGCFSIGTVLLREAKQDYSSSARVGLDRFSGKHP